jgi:kinesin family protein 26
MQQQGQQQQQPRLQAKDGILDNLSEVRCPTPERAGQLLDAALTARRKAELVAAGGDVTRDSHFVYTLHVYQYSVAGGGENGVGVGAVIGGRSRLHLIDFGCCERMKTSNGGITLSGLGHAILAIFNGQKHVPFRDSKVTQLLRECLGSISCQVRRTLILMCSSKSCFAT